MKQNLPCFIRGKILNNVSETFISTPAVEVPEFYEILDNNVTVRQKNVGHCTDRPTEFYKYIYIYYIALWIGLYLKLDTDRPTFD